MALAHFFLEQQVIEHEVVKTPGGLGAGKVVDEAAPGTPAAQSAALAASPEFELKVTPEDRKHMRALRLAPGEHMAVIDAAGVYYECELVRVEDVRITARVAQRLQAPVRPTVHLYCGLVKGDKVDFIIRHATEVGVSRFVLMACARSVVVLNTKKVASRRQRWQAIAKSAAMQSGQVFIPKITVLPCVDAAVTELSAYDAVLVCYEGAPLEATFVQALQHALASGGVNARAARVAVVVGPEGGFEQTEVESFLAANEQAYSVSLGPSILRSETAGILAPAYALYELEHHA